jgi:hypothetical protein
MMREWRGNVALEGVPTHVGALTECVEIKLDGQGNQWHPGRPRISLDSSGARTQI